MQKSYRELSKLDVINLPDGRDLGRITDITFNFPEGIIIGITVPGKKQSFIKRLLSFFRKEELYIERKKIIKIGNDVILVDLSGKTPKPKPTPPIKPCSPQCPPPCPPYPENLCLEKNDNFIDKEFSNFDPFEY